MLTSKTSHVEETKLIGEMEWLCRIKDFRTGVEFFGRGQTIEEAKETAKKEYFKSDSYKSFVAMVLKRRSGRVYLVAGVILAFVSLLLFNTIALFASWVGVVLLVAIGLVCFFKGILMLLKYY